MATESPDEYEVSTETKILWGGGRYLGMLLCPWVELDPDAPLDTRLWRWRYTYLLFVPASLLIMTEGLLAGDLWLLPIAIAPHVLAIPFLAWAYTMGPLTAIGIPGVAAPDWVLLAGLVAISWVAVGGETLRRQSSAVPGLSQPTYHRWAESFVLPMRRYVDRSSGASYLPHLDQDVSTLALGETGAGKTAALELLAYQLPYDRGTAVIAHDYKTDYQEFYEELGFEVVRIAVEDSDVVWNLFEDVQKEREYRELAETVFGKPQGNDPFHGPAKQVFHAILTYLDREAETNHVSHADLVEFLQLERATMQARLEEHGDLRRYAQHLDSETGKSAMNVYQELQEYTGKVFVGDFAADGSFSLRDYVENPAGRILIIDSTPAEMETVGPMFRLLTDWAIRFGMESETEVNFILDEVDRLPALKQLPAVTAAGRSEDTRALVGVQTVGQLEARYETRTDAVLGNCPQGIYFAPGEQASIDHTQSELGVERQITGSETVSERGDEDAARSRSRTTRETDRHPIPSAELKQFGTGECIVKSREHWWEGKLYELEEIAHRLDVEPTPPTSPAASETTGTDAGSTPDPADAAPSHSTHDPGNDHETATPSVAADGEAGAEQTDSASGSPQVETPAPESSTQSTVPDPTDDPSEDEPDPSAITDDPDASAVTEGPDASTVGDDPEASAVTEDPEPVDVTTDSGATPDESIDDRPTTDDQLPQDLCEQRQWQTWKPEDSRKIPRAPWTANYPDKYVSAQDPDVWTSLSTAREATENYDGHELAYTIRPREQFPEEDLVLVDYDDVRDPDTGELHPTVRDHLTEADSYAQVSTSGTGVHILCRGELPEQVKAIESTLPHDEAFPDAGIEVYETARFIAMTGDHLVGTPAQTTDAQAFLEELADTFATVPESAPDEVAQEPETAPEELASIETTDDIQDVLDAIQYIGPGDIRLRSTVTEERADGSKSLDPSWVDSESGTRLAQVEDGWIYRKGMYFLDALQVVALEEGIILRPETYPSGEDFWAAVDALRDRGAHIPTFTDRTG